MNFTNIPATKEQFIRTLKIIYFAILGGLVLLYIAVTVILPSPTEPGFSPEDMQMIKLILPIINFVLVGAGALVYRMKIKSAARADSEVAKIKEYTMGYVTRLAMLEGLGFLDLFGYYLTGEFMIVLLFGLVFVLMVASSYPNAEKIYSEINL